VTTAAPPPPTAELEVPATAPADVGARGEGPGRLRIDPRVVQKLAAQAANEVRGVSRASAAPVPRAIHRPVPASTPRDQLAVDLDLMVSVQYPMSVRAVVEHLAAHVSARVEQLTGRPVGRVRVEVQRLVGPDEGDRPRVR